MCARSCADAFADERSRALDRRLRLGRRIQLDERDAQAGVGNRQRRIDAQRLVERTRRFDPDVGMQVGQALVVERLRFFRLRADRVVRRPDPVRNGTGRFRSSSGTDGTRWIACPCCAATPMLSAISAPMASDVRCTTQSTPSPQSIPIILFSAVSAVSAFELSLELERGVSDEREVRARQGHSARPHQRRTRSRTARRS